MNRYAAPDLFEQELELHKQNLLACVTAFEEHAQNLRRAQEALQSSEETVRAFFENASQAILTVDTSGSIRQVNAMTTELFGYSREELVGFPLEMLLPESSRDRHRGHRAAYFAEPRPRPMGLGIDLAARRKDGTEFPVEISLSHVRTKAGVVAVAFISDITERKRAAEALLAQSQELARSNADLQQFAFATSHDLQEPLRMISSYAELLKLKYQHKIDEDADEYIDYIVEGSRRLEALIQDMLSFSRVANIESVPRSRVSLDSVVAWAQQNLDVAIQESGAIIEVGALGSISGNQIQFVQVFQNLISNAIKHCRRGVIPRIKIQAERRNDSVVVTVEDNGPGIKPQYHEHIFGVFKRLNRDTSGTGIGLAICKRIVESHHGRIWVESVPEHGSRFVMTLPTEEWKDEHSSGDSCASSSSRTTLQT